MVWLLHMPLSMQTTLAILHLPYYQSSSLLPHMTHSQLHHLCIQGGHLRSIYQLSHLFISLLLLKSIVKGMEASSGLYFWDHHTPIQIVAKPREALDTAIVVAIRKPSADA